MKNFRLKIFSVFLAFWILLPVSALNGGQAEIHSKTLKNGLEIFVSENNSAPLVYIEIAFRTGAVSQSPSNAGLFHLYEHMMFKGNEKYRNQKEFMEALNSLGVADWNGTTGVDRVNYFFTIPSSMLREGMEFWSLAIRSPLLTEEELENEKKVVISEITGNQTNSGRIMSAGLSNSLYKETPWKLDPSGSPEVVKNCTVEQLRSIQKEFYVPSNAALFIGGDVNAEKVFLLAEEIFGDWENSFSVQKNAPKENFGTKKTFFNEDLKFVFADPRNSGNIVQFSYYLHGPDGKKDSSDTYAADVWSYIANNPGGNFINSVTKGDFNIPDGDYAGVYYSTRRESGIISLAAAMINTKDFNACRTADSLLEFIKKSAIPQMAEKGKGFDEENIKVVQKTISDSRIYSSETPEGILSELSYTWASCSSSYYFDYDEKISRVTEDDVLDFVKKYLLNKNGVCMISVSPALYEENKKEFEESGWVLLESSNAFWWN